MIRQANEEVRRDLTEAKETVESDHKEYQQTGKLQRVGKQFRRQNVPDSVSSNKIRFQADHQDQGPEETISPKKPCVLESNTVKVLTMRINGYPSAPFKAKKAVCIHCVMGDSPVPRSVIKET